MALHANLIGAATLPNRCSVVVQGWYYQTAGLSAWGDSGPVPFEITSNAFIARHYANLALAMLPGVADVGSDSDQPLYVVELGAGHVRVSPCVLHRR